MLSYNHNSTPSGLWARANRGFSLTAVVIGILLFTTGLAYYGQSIVGNRRTVKFVEQKNVAENYAAELLETFMSISNTQFATYLSAVPGVPGSPAYPLCAHINLMDRANSGTSITYFNRDPLADLPGGSFLENAKSTKYAANRFYMVQVVDASTLTVKTPACGRTPANNASPGVNGTTYTLWNGVPTGSPVERFMVTVGVTFVPIGKTEDQAERIVVTSILPEF